MTKNNWICDCDLIVMERNVCQCGRIRDRRGATLYELHGEKRSIRDWCSLYEINVGSFRQRIKRGWPFELALVAPKFWSPKTNREF